MAHVHDWSDARPGDVTTGGCNGPCLIVRRRVRRKQDAARIAGECCGFVSLDGPRSWAVCLYLEPCK